MQTYNSMQCVCSCLTQNYISALKLNPNCTTATSVQSLAMTSQSELNS